MNPTKTCTKCKVCLNCNNMVFESENQYYYCKSQYKEIYDLKNSCDDYAERKLEEIC